MLCLITRSIDNQHHAKCTEGEQFCFNTNKWKPYRMEVQMILAISCIHFLFIFYVQRRLKFEYTDNPSKILKCLNICMMCILVGNSFSHGSGVSTKET